MTTGMNEDGEGDSTKYQYYADLTLETTVRDSTIVSLNESNRNECGGVCLRKNTHKRSRLNEIEQRKSERENERENEYQRWCEVDRSCSPS